MDTVPTFSYNEHKCCGLQTPSILSVGLGNGQGPEWEIGQRGPDFPTFQGSVAKAGNVTGKVRVDDPLGEDEEGDSDDETEDEEEFTDSEPDSDSGEEVRRDKPKTYLLRPSPPVRQWFAQVRRPRSPQVRLVHKRKQLVVQDVLPQWQKAIPRRSAFRVMQQAITMETTVCGRHFLGEDIITHDVKAVQGGGTIVVPKFRPVLRKNAVPCKFESTAEYEPAPPPEPVAPPAAIEVYDESDMDTELPPTLQRSVTFTPFRESQPPKRITRVVIHSIAHTVKLPGMLWGVHTDKENKTAFTIIDEHLRTQKAVVFTHSLKPLVLINKTVLDMPEVKNKKDIEALLLKLHCMKPCMGVLEQGTKDQEWSEKCTGYASFKSSRCEPCKILARALTKSLHYMKGKTTDSGNSLDKLRKRMKYQGRCILRLKKEVKLLNIKIDKTMKQMSKIKHEKIGEIIQLLPPEQQSLVKACFEASKHHSNKGRRYATD
ncbi:Heat-inducible transcription repressor [Frankliniella fusca]|uniref:Heat-inducible transcription repressor n=1 Tax=Frankliniella fusca TaxID=407009 RepID=A0AAE1HD20_9NEOP|nr:Heat-inducible transcription repressor [Frankliniella fusca]